MCRFFTTRNLTKFTAATSIAVPLILTIVTFQQSKKDLGAICINWLIGASVALTAGYYMRDDKPCPLPHLAENIEVEQSRIEGQQRQSISLRNL